MNAIIQQKKIKSIETELFSLLIDTNPQKIKAGRTKTTSNIYLLDTKQALETCEFINFNTDKINWLIFDIDFIDENLTAKQHFKSSSNFLLFIKNELKIQPNYVLATTKGFHFGFYIKGVEHNDEYTIARIKNIRENITSHLNCDSHANRIFGVFRNPLLAEDLIITECETPYSLDAFKEYEKGVIKKSKSSKSKPKKSPEENDFQDIEFSYDKSIFKKIYDNSSNERVLTPIGSRNSDMFNKVRLKVRNICRDKLTFNSVLLLCVSFNASCVERLPDNEVLSVAKSIYKYSKINNKIRGTMEYDKMKNLSADDYEAEKQKRQKDSAYRTHVLRKSKTIDKIQQGIKELEANNQKITASSLSKHLNISRQAISKYLKDLTL